MRLANFVRKDKNLAMDKLLAEIKLCPSCNFDECNELLSDNILRGKGSLDAKIMIVGIAPTYYRTTGALFTNAANRTDNVVIKALEFCGIKRDSVFVTNLSKGSTKNNRDLKEVEKQHLAKHLFKEIRIISPRVVVFMGKMFETAFSYEHRVFLDMDDGSFAKFGYIPHPAAVIYGSVNQNDFNDAMKIAVGEVEK